MYRIFVSLVCIVAFLGAALADDPMSPCTPGRATVYSYTSQASGGGNGACSFQGLQGPYLPTKYVAAYNELFYNNASRCGECWELTSSVGSVVVTIADMCPATPDNTLCYGDVDHLDLGSTETFNFLGPATVGSVLLTKRQVACPVSGNVGVLMESSASTSFLGLLIFNHKVGITKVELQSQGTWYNLPRASYNYWHYSSTTTALVTPLTVRITGQTNEQVTATISTITPSGTVTANAQFSDPPAGFGGGSSAQCTAPVPPPQIYEDALYKNPSADAAWQDWSYATSIDFSSTNNPKVGTYCAAITIQGYAGVQWGRGMDFVWANYYTSISFWIRGDSAFNDLSFGFGSATKKLSVTTQWQLVTVDLASINTPASIGNTQSFKIQNNNDKPSPQFYLDEVVFGGSPSSTSAASTTASSSTTSKGTSAASYTTNKASTTGSASTTNKASTTATSAATTTSKGSTSSELPPAEINSSDASLSTVAMAVVGCLVGLALLI